MTAEIVGALIALAAALLLEEAAAWFLGNAIEARGNGDEEATQAASRSARQARLLSRFLIAVGFGLLVVGFRRFGHEGSAAGVIALGLVWVGTSAALSGTHRRSPWTLAGRVVLSPLRVVGEILRGILLAGGRIPGLGAPGTSVDRVEELDRELRWLRGESARDEAESMVATLHQFGEALVEDVMVRREAVIALPRRAAVPEILGIVRAQGYSRYPVQADSLDTVVGVLHVLDLVGASPQRTAEELARPAYFTPSTKPVGALLRELQTTYNQMAVVVDEYGGIAGLVTIEDLLEELVGEIEDELDEEPPRIRRLEPGVFWVDATTAVKEVNEALEIDLDEGEYDTVSGLLLERLEHVPRVGEAIRESGVRIEVLAAEPHRIQSVKLVLSDGKESGSKPGV